MQKYEQANLLIDLKKDYSTPVMAGIDEVGRGSLAGPVVTSAVILPEKYDLSGLTDSKKLLPRKREELAVEIRKVAVAWSIGLIGQRAIDRLNILQSTFMAMAMAAARLPVDVNLLLIDGNKIIPQGILRRFWQKHKNAPLPKQQAQVHGDSLEPMISAASILAKTYRDAIMRHLSTKWPLYGFADHFGYGTKAHLQKLAELGPCPLHRITFRGVLPKAASTKKIMQGSLLAFL